MLSEREADRAAHREHTERLLAEEVRLDRQAAESGGLYLSDGQRRELEHFKILEAQVRFADRLTHFLHFHSF